MTPLKVIYDISVLGTAYRDPRGKTGIFRVVEQIAKRLTRRPDVTLFFSSIVSLSHTIKYLQTIESFNNTPLPCSYPILWTERTGNYLSELSNKYSFPAKQGIKILRETFRGANKLLLSQYGSVCSRNLAECDIFHSTYYPLPADAKSKLKFITVYDLIPILYPQFFEFNTDHLVNHVIKSIDSNTWIFCISESTKCDLLNFHRHIDPDKIAVVPLGASELFYPSTDSSAMSSVREKYNIPDKPYFLSLSTLEPRKNIGSTIKAFIKLIQQEKLDEVNLVLVGTKGWDYKSIFNELPVAKDLLDRIIITGRVEDSDLASIYSGALAFVYPSFYEGFGLPPLEAMQCGIPVVTSNNSSLPEVIGNAGILINPLDIEALCQEMLNLYQSDTLRKRLSELSLQRAKDFSWDICADQTVNHYIQALNSSTK